jgi:hypothetical protein
MSKELCPQTPSGLWDYLDSHGITFVLLSRPENDGVADEWDSIDELGPNVVMVTDTLVSSTYGLPESEDREERHRAQEIDNVIQESVRRLKLREDLAFTIFWHVPGCDESHLVSHPEMDRGNAMERILHFIHHDLSMMLL